MKPNIQKNAILAVLFALWLLVLANCGGGSQEEQGVQEESAGSAVSGEFVGEAPDANDAFLALVAREPREGEQTREVSAYLFDGESINEWFWGSAEGNELSLTSDGGARLEGALDPGSATGMITSPGGASFPFSAPLASGVAGLYEVVLSPEGDFSGASETGGRLEGELLEEQGLREVSGAITPPEGGEPVQIERSSIDDASPGEYRWIVAPDGEVKGAKRGESTSSTSDWSDPDVP